MSDDTTNRTGFVNPPPTQTSAQNSGIDVRGTVTPLTPRPAAETKRPTPSVSDTNVESKAGSISEQKAQRPAAPDVASSLMPENEESVGKIRDILFGGHMREYEIRFQNLEAHLQSESRRSQEEIERRFGRLEDYIREEFGKLSSRLQHETSERTQATKALETSISTAEGRMSSIMHTLDTGLKNDYQDLRRNLYDLGLEQEQKLREARGELIASMQTHSRQLQNDKMGRDTLATLLDDLAARVRTDNDSD